MNTLFSLTKNELEIMELLWSEKRGLSRSEITELCQNRSWKTSSVHILLNKLLDKGAIKVDGYVRTGKNYGRTFAAAITEEEYQVMQFKKSSGYLQSKSSAITGFFSALFHDEEVDEETLEQLDSILKEQRSKTEK